MGSTLRNRLILALTLNNILGFVLAQGHLDQAGHATPDRVGGPPPGTPETPEHPDSDIHVDRPPEPHPDIVGDPENPPAPPKSDQHEHLGGQANDLKPPIKHPAHDSKPVHERPPSDVDTPLTDTKPDGGDRPTNDPFTKKPGPHNPWQIPSPGQPSVELKAGTAFNFTWIPNTEGPINLELWQIDDNIPVPKFLIASEVANNGSWNWGIHRHFPHGTGYCLVIVPPERKHASLSPLFTIHGDADYDTVVPESTEDLHSLSDLEVSHAGTQPKFLVAVGAGFLLCNLFGVLIWLANERSKTQVESQPFYSHLEKDSGKRVFHARVQSVNT